jgi:hypothetical protein
MDRLYSCGIGRGVREDLQVDVGVRISKRSDRGTVRSPPSPASFLKLSRGSGDGLVTVTPHLVQV